MGSAACGGDDGPHPPSHLLKNLPMVKMPRLSRRKAAALMGATLAGAQPGVGRAAAPGAEGFLDVLDRMQAD